MKISTTELALAREILDRLLDQLGIPVYRFEVEPNGEGWLLIIECETADGWQRASLETGREALSQAAGEDQQAARQVLQARLDELLNDCLRIV